MKKFLRLFLTLVLMVSVVVPTNAICADSLDDTVIQSRDVCDKPHIRGDAEIPVAATFANVEGKGKIVRVWYQNKSKDPVRVILQKMEHRRFGKSEWVDVFSPPFLISGKGDGWREYTANDADNASYRIKLTATNGGLVEGYLRAVQTDTSGYT